MRRDDVIILGGGIIGCALAEELARRGQRVVVIERGRIGQEASSAAAGILSAQMDIPTPGPFFELCQASRRLYPQWVKRLERTTGVSVAYHQDGILYLAMTAAQARRMSQRVGWQRARGLRAERWSSAEVHRREPAIDGRIVSGFYFPTEAQVDNERLMQALAIACRQAGVQLQEKTSAQRLIVRRRSVRGVLTSRGAVHAPIVVNCLGSWATLGGHLGVRIPVEPARGQMLAFDGPKRLVRSAVMSDRAYVVQRRDGRLIVGSTIERVGFEKALTIEGVHAILCGLRHMTHALDQATFRSAWAGLRPYTSDQLPILGATPIEGLFVATGHFRHGILLAPITATLMAELICSRRPSGSLLPFSPGRFVM